MNNNNLISACVWQAYVAQRKEQINRQLFITPWYATGWE